MAPGSANPRLRLVRRVVGEPAGGTRPGALTELDDVQLVALARDGDVRAFEALYRRHAAFAMNLAVRIQGSISDVEDVVHDAFLRAQLRLGELRETLSERMIDVNNDDALVDYLVNKSYSQKYGARNLRRRSRKRWRTRRRRC